MNLFQWCLVALTIATSLVTARPRTTLPVRSQMTSSASSSRYVFAHFIVGIVSNRQSAADWDADMIRAKAYGIDAFALNIGTNTFTDQQLGYAYTSAANNGMKVFLSIDFNWWSTGGATAVGQKIAQYAGLPAQLMVDGKPFVSSFGGDGLDVTGMRNTVGIPIYFAPNFHPSYGTDMSVVDGAFNWLGWPNNGNNRAPNPGQTGTVEAGDSQYMSALGTKDYMAPVSPWFFTHYGAEVSYSKNWLFPGDMLFYQRWTQLLSLGPRFIEIVSWNDFGESHYIGPLSSPHVDDGASKWINDMPHDGWLDMAKPFIAAFKANATSVNNFITSDQLIYWYRPQPMNTNCDATDTCMQPVNNADYYIGPPNGWQTVTDNVFVVSLLQSPATLQITSGNTTQTFSAPAGASSFTVPMGVGKQKFVLTRNSQTVLSGTSLKDIINGCVCGLYNFNAYVGTLPDGASDPLRSDGYSGFATGLVVSTCSATPSLGTASSTASTTTSTGAANGSLTTTSGPYANMTTTTTTCSVVTTNPTTYSSLSALTTTTQSPMTSSTTTTSVPTSTLSSIATPPGTTSSTTSTTSSSSTTSAIMTTSASTSSSTATPTTTSPSTTAALTTTTASTTPAPTTTSSTTSSTTASPTTSAATTSSSTSSTPVITSTSSSTTSPAQTTTSSTTSSSSLSSLTTTSQTTAAALRKTIASSSSTTSSTVSPTTTSSSTTSPMTTLSSTTTSKSTTASTTSSTLSPTTTSPTTTSTSKTTSSTTTIPSTSSSTTTTPSTSSSTTAATTTKSSSTSTTTSSTVASATTSSSSSSKSSTSLTTTTSATKSSTISSTTTTSTTSSASPVCTSGSGSGNYGGLCSFCCNYGYCPPGPCTCNAYGAQVQPPPSNGVNGIPAAGLDSSYSGLCSYACSHGYCPSGACQVAS